MRPADWGATATDFAAYLRVAGRGSEETARTYVARARLFAEWCLDWEICPEEADKRAITRWLAYRESPGHKPKPVSSYTLRNDLYGLKAYFEFLVWAEIRADDPTEGMKRKRPKTLPKQPLSLDDTKKLVYGTLSKRDRAIMAFFYATGVRLAEVAGIQIEHIFWADGVVAIHGKGDKWRPVEPGPDTMELLREVAGQRCQGPLWLNKYGGALNKNTIRHNFDALSKRQGVKAHPHKMRVTFANVYLNEGGDLGSLKELFGHADITTTAHYQQATALTRGLAAMQRMNLGARIA